MFASLGDSHWGPLGITFGGWLVPHETSSLDQKGRSIQALDIQRVRICSIHTLPRVLSTQHEYALTIYWGTQKILITYDNILFKLVLPLNNWRLVNPQLDKGLE